MTTTGATVIVGLDDLPRGVLLWRGIVTWIGGIGVILLAMILLPVLNIGGMQMLRNADFNTLGKIMPRAKSIALSIGAVYLVLTLACALGYLWAGMSGFDAIAHAMSTHRHRRHGQPRQLLRRASARPRSTSPPSSCCSAPCPSSASSSSPAASRGRSSRDSQIRAFLAIYRRLRRWRCRRALAERRRARRDDGARGAVQPRLGHLHHRLHLHRLLALGAARRGDLLLRHDDLRLLRLDRRRARRSSATSSSSARSPARSAGCTARAPSSPRTSRASPSPTT